MILSSHSIKQGKKQMSNKKNQEQIEKAIKVYMEQQQVVLSEEVQNKLLNSFVRFTLLEFAAHIDTIEFYEEKLVYRMNKLHLQWLVSRKSPDWIAGPKAEETVRSLHHCYQELQDARTRIQICIIEIEDSIDILTMN